MVLAALAALRREEERTVKKLKSSAVLIAVAGGILALGSGPVFADSTGHGARGSVSWSVPVPKYVPFKLCSSGSVDLVGATSGNFCLSN